MGLISEFKEFAVKGNAIDMAVGIILGGAFGKVVTSVVEDLIMPPIGAMGKADFTNYYLPLSDKITDGIDYASAKKLGPAVGYGNFVTILINFLIVAFAVFLLVKAMNAARRDDDEPEAPAAPPADIALLTEIRDLLGKKA